MGCLVLRTGRWLAWAVVAMTMSFCAPAIGAEDERLALKGYDPVAYFVLSRAAPGDPRFQAEWDGAVYRFVSASHMAQFRADPDRYLPQYGNLCTASLALGRRVTPDPRIWAVHDGKLFLFGSAEGVKAMNANPAAVKARADASFLSMSRPQPR